MSSLESRQDSDVYAQHCQQDIIDRLRGSDVNRHHSWVKTLSDRFLHAHARWWAAEKKKNPPARSDDLGFSRFDNAAGLSSGTSSRIAAGRRRRVSYEHIDVIAKTLGVRTSWLANGDGEERAQGDDDGALASELAASVDGGAQRLNEDLAAAVRILGPTVSSAAVERVREKKYPVSTTAEQFVDYLVDAQRELISEMTIKTRRRRERAQKLAAESIAAAEQVAEERNNKTG